MASSGAIPLIELSEEEDASRSANSKPKHKPRILKKRESVENDTMDNTDGGSTGKGGKWTKYSKKYKPQWEKLEVFANWLHRTPENLLMMGKPEAYCVFCQQCLRAHKSDLLAHAKSKKHKDAENNTTTPTDCRSFIESYVPDLDDQAKNEPAYEARTDSPIRRTRGRQSKQTANKVAIVEQINAELEETEEKIKVCEEELNNLRIKKARLEFEYEHYNNN